MKFLKKSFINRVLMFSLLIVFCGCSNRPTDIEVLNLVKPGGFVLQKEIFKKGSSQKNRGTKVFSYSVSIKYIRPGLTYGYVSECPEAQCCKDVEIEKKTEYLIGKNQWNEWEIFESRTLEENEVREIWRPSSTTQEEFYKDYK